MRQVGLQGKGFDYYSTRTYVRCLLTFRGLQLSEGRDRGVSLMPAYDLRSNDHRLFVCIMSHGINLKVGNLCKRRPSFTLCR